MKDAEDYYYNMEDADEFTVIGAIRMAQIEAYNEAIDAASDTADIWMDRQWMGITEGYVNIVRVDKDSILKLKKND